MKPLGERGEDVKRCLLLHAVCAGLLQKKSLTTVFLLTAEGNLVPAAAA